MSTARLPFIWDYDLDEDEFRRLLSGALTVGRLDRKWAAVRLLEHAPYREVVRLMGFRDLVKGWPEWRDHIRSESRKRGFDFLVAWLPEHHPELVQPPGHRADSAFYLTRLYPMQNGVLARLASVETGFYLTGGTAASRAYLHHRFSDDLDFFVNDDARFGLWAQRVVQALAGSGGWHVTVVQQDARFVRLAVVGGDLVLKIENILANKLTAVVDRDEPRDLADIWGFCCRMGLSCEAALEGAQSKAAGLFPADVARVRDPPDCNRFIDDLRALGERLLLLH